MDLPTMIQRAYFVTESESLLTALWAARDQNPGAALLIEIMEFQRWCDSRARSWAEVRDLPQGTSDDLAAAVQDARSFLTEHLEELEEMINGIGVHGPTSQG